MNAEDLFRFAMKQDLQRTDAHTDNLRSRQVFELRARPRSAPSLRVSCCSVLPTELGFPEW